MIKFSCPACRAAKFAPDDMLGQEAICFDCGCAFTVPAATPSWSPALWVGGSFCSCMGIYVLTYYLWHISQEGNPLALLVSIPMCFFGLFGLLITWSMWGKKKP